MTPRVLMVVGAYDPELAGGSLQCRTLAQALRARADVAVLTTTADRGLPAESVVDGVPVTRIFVDPRHPLTKATALPRLVAAARRELRHRSVLHVHGVTEKLLPLMAAARLSGCPVVVKLTSVGWDDPLALARRRWGRALAAAVRRAERVVAVSPAMRDRCHDGGVTDARLVLVPNGVDTAAFAPADKSARAAARRALGVPEDGVLVAFVGFWSREKGPDVLFEAWLAARQRAAGPVRLLYVGATREHAEVDPALVESVRQQAADAGALADVTFVERTTRVADYLRASDIFALPSAREGLPNALLEAMACGLPSVVADLPGITDFVIESGTDGYIVPQRNSAALAEVLVTLAGDPALRADVGRRARLTIERRFAITAVAARYVDLYTELSTAR